MRSTPTIGQELYRNGKLYARIENITITGHRVSYTIRRYIQSRREWSKSTGDYPYIPTH